MLNRDFSKSNKEYFKKNRVALILVATFLLLGVLMLSIFGMNGNFEMRKYNEFSVYVGSEAKVSHYSSEIKDIVNKYNGDFDNVSKFDVGDDTRLVVRYMNTLSKDKQDSINVDIIKKFNLENGTVSEHKVVGSAVRTRDYVFTAAAILLIIAVMAIFAAIRYNGASAITVIISSLIGTLGFMSLGAILRLEIGMSYFALLVLFNLLLVYVYIDLFENMRSSSWLKTQDYSNALNSAMKSSRSRLCVLSVAILLIGVLFVIIAPTPIKYVSLNIMFMAVSLLAVAIYVVPFTWSVFITLCKRKSNTVKVSNKEVK